MTRYSILVPYMGKTAHWRRVFAYTQREWQRALQSAPDLDVEIVAYEQRANGPMHVSRCDNRAAARATGDVFVLWGADHLPDVGTLRWLDMVRTFKWHEWQPLFERTAVYSEQSTARILAGESPDGVDIVFDSVVNLCIGIFAVSRDAFEALGGEDERFTGWGMEDAAFRHALTAFYGEPSAPRPGSVLRSLWHPVQRRDRCAAANVTLYHGEYVDKHLDTQALSDTIERARAARLPE